MVASTWASILFSGVLNIYVKPISLYPAWAREERSEGLRGGGERKPREEGVHLALSV